MIFSFLLIIVYFSLNQGENIADDFDASVQGTYETATEQGKPLPVIFSCFPSTKDPSFAQRYPGKSTCQLLMFTPWAWFEHWKDERVKKRGEVSSTPKSEHTYPHDNHNHSPKGASLHLELIEVEQYDSLSSTQKQRRYYSRETC